MILTEDRGDGFPFACHTVLICRVDTDVWLPDQRFHTKDHQKHPNKILRIPIAKRLGCGFGIIIMHGIPVGIISANRTVICSCARYLQLWLL